jgi:hypothetical protein
MELYIDRYGGDHRLLRLAEKLNYSEFAPWLSLVDETSPRCGATRAAVSSTSRPASHMGGRSSSSNHQVVLSLAAALAARTAVFFCSVEWDLIAL